MARILQWTEADISGLMEGWGLSRILTEIGDDGSFTRELGFNVEGHLVHRFPGEPSRAKYGVFDLAKIEALSGADLTAEEFELLWSS
jgi:hypothetical protein